MADTDSTTCRPATADGEQHRRPNQPPRGAPPDFETIVAQSEQQITRLAHRLLGWRGDVEDVVQDVFLKVLESRPKFRGDARLETWLYRITVNRCRQEFRKRLLRLRFWRSPDPEPTAAAPATLNDPELHARVRAAVASMPRTDREVIILRYLEELPLPDIGMILGLSREALDTRLSRARRRLKDVLATWVED